MGKDKKKDKTSKHIKCDVLFDNNPQGVFRAGDTVSGTVEIQLDKPKKVRGIALRISGFAQTNWNAKVKGTTEKAKKKNKKTHFSGREDYFGTITYFVGSDVGNPLEVPAGVHRYPFFCVIPATVPTSKEGKYGHIRYLVKVSLERPWKYDHVFQMPFIVQSHADLNVAQDRMLVPTRAEVIQSFYFGLTDPLIVTATTPRTGYAPGEVIEVSVHVNNQSSVDVRDIQIKFQRIDTFLSQVPTEQEHLEHTVLEERTIARVARRNDAVFEENILIGSTVPSDDERCKIIRTRYEVTILVRPVRSRKKLLLTLPLVIGTVGLPASIYPMQMLAKEREALGLNAVTEAGLADVAGPSGIATSFELPPPPYREDSQPSSPTARVFSPTDMDDDEAAATAPPTEHEFEKGSEPYTPRDFDEHD
ncbi:arrestin domain-containing protein 17-like [Anopheles darlingi]|uniref:arrestin domain-containing protein 17-like n=1 Tax=Anopheles darlingi TaxID=43151 RepID=UPI00210000DA|nr:arrestin domain-containing protein 17-like [Anopheles darlingi]